jgi:hypothetical protein
VVVHLRLCNVRAGTRKREKGYHSSNATDGFEFDGVSRPIACGLRSLPVSATSEIYQKDIPRYS